MSEGHLEKVWDESVRNIGNAFTLPWGDIAIGQCCNTWCVPDANKSPVLMDVADMEHGNVSGFLSRDRVADSKGSQAYWSPSIWWTPDGPRQRIPSNFVRSTCVAVDVDGPGKTGLANVARLTNALPATLALIPSHSWESRHSFHVLAGLMEAATSPYQMASYAANADGF